MDKVFFVVFVSFVAFVVLRKIAAIVDGQPIGCIS
jgi:hypothetical protein